MIRDLSLYQTFVAVAEQPTLTAAAAALGRSVQAVSRDLGRLETILGAKLLLRTTRRQQLTPAGEAFYERIRRLLSELEDAEEEVRARTSRVAGALKIVGPTLFGPRFLVPAIAEFLQAYPEVSVVLELGDAFIDPVVSRADVTIRIGDQPNSPLISRRLAEISRVIVAAPAYLDRRGAPRVPADLVGHDCVVRHGDSEAARWKFGEGAEAATVAVKGHFETNSVPAQIEAISRGLGIGVVAYWQVKDRIESGELAVLLPESRFKPRPIRALWTPSAPLPARARLFVDLLAKRLASEVF